MNPPDPLDPRLKKAGEKATTEYTENTEKDETTKHTKSHEGDPKESNVADMWSLFWNADLADGADEDG